jgi:hypothetical protein
MLRRLPLTRGLAFALAGVLFAKAGADAAAADRVPGIVPAWLDRAAVLAEVPLRPTGTTLVVQNCADSGPGSLREAIAQVAGDTTIDLDALACSTITLTTGALADAGTAGPIRIHRAAAYAAGRKVPTLAIDGGANGRVIEHGSSAPMYLYGVHIRNGHFAGDTGGCIDAVGPLYLDGVSVTDCVLTATGNYAGGGAIYARASLGLSFSTISGNVVESASGYTYGGGIFSAYALGMVYSTVDSNEAKAIGYGGGIAARAIVFVENSLVSNNAAQYDGGMALFGNAPIQRGLEIVNSTIALNFARGIVGGIQASDPLYIYNSTIAFNEGLGAARAGGIVMDGGGLLSIESTIVANNLAAGAWSDIGGSGTVSGSHNIVLSSTDTLPADTIVADPVLGVLADHGGQTLTMPLLPGSPAIDAGSNELNANCDQRAGNFSQYDNFITMYDRVIGPNADIGAYETGADDEIFPNGFDGPPFIAHHCIRRS